MWRVCHAIGMMALVGACGAAQAQPAVTLTAPPPLEQVTDFKAQPLAILAKFPTAGAAMAAFVATLVTTQPGVMDAVLSVVEVSTPEQASSMGAGLVRAARALASTHPELVRDLKQKIDRSENVWLKTTFEALGYRYSAFARFVESPAVAPRELANAPIGYTLQGEAGRVGGEDASRREGFPLTTDASKTHAATVGAAGRSRTGMIVALIQSDASKNGARSTSPTE